MEFLGVFTGGDINNITYQYIYISINSLRNIAFRRKKKWSCGTTLPPVGCKLCLWREYIGVNCVIDIYLMNCNAIEKQDKSIRKNY